MQNLKFADINNAQFRLYEGNPIIRNPWNSFVVADPSVLTPYESHNGKWQLFCHTFFGIYRYESENGIDFVPKNKIVNHAMRPDINYIDGRYYLFYEKTGTPIYNALCSLGLKWKSEIFVTESVDLESWTQPRLALGKTRYYEEDERARALSNPFLIKKDDGYRLYYSCGQTFIKDCGFCEPRHISFAESKSITEGYVSREEPIISPDKNKEYLNLCSGCIKVYKLSDCYVGLQNGLFEKDGISHSAIMLLRSDDGENFDFVRPFLVPQMCGDNNWMAQYVYACNLTYYNGKLRLYFNARDTSSTLKGRECIGVYEAEI
ncbi:MAG: glycosyl hydrolase family 43 [Clostridia bacterium]|nr:glycosyl hydrolase family 43 [Clostridia bacterium]